MVERKSYSSPLFSFYTVLGPNVFVSTTNDHSIHDPRPGVVVEGRRTDEFPQMAIALSCSSTLSMGAVQRAASSGVRMHQLVPRPRLLSLKQEYDYLGRIQVTWFAPHMQLLRQCIPPDDCIKHGENECVI